MNIVEDLSRYAKETYGPTFDYLYQKAEAQRETLFGINATTYRFWKEQKMPEGYGLSGVITEDDGAIYALINATQHAVNYLFSEKNRNQFPEETASIAKRLTGYTKKLAAAIADENKKNKAGNCDKCGHTNGEE